MFAIPYPRVFVESIEFGPSCVPRDRTAAAKTSIETAQGPWVGGAEPNTATGFGSLFAVRSGVALPTLNGSASTLK